MGKLVAYVTKAGKLQQTLTFDTQNKNQRDKLLGFIYGLPEMEMGTIVTFQKI